MRHTAAEIAADTVPLDADTRARALSALRDDGYCLLRPADTGAAALLGIASAFGTVQMHIRADANGMVGGGESHDASWKRYREEYIGTVSSAMAPHCDGSFLDGVLKVDGVLRRVEPPALLLLQCVRAATRGGEHLVVDGAAIVEDLLEDDPETIRILMSPGCIVICRDDQLATQAPVLALRPDGSLRLRFRYDAKTYAPAWAERALRVFHERTTSAEYCREIAQRSGEILVLDNHRALHGRTAFEDEPGEKRALRRVWIREDDERLQGVLQQPAEQRALDRYAAYGPVGELRSRVASGIRLAPERLRLLERFAFAV